MNNKFCTNCGALINPSAKFCGKCGSAIVAEQQNQTSQEPGASGENNAEEYVYILPGQFKKGMISLRACTLLFTKTAVIVAMVDNKLMQEHISSIKEGNKGEKFFKRTAAVMKAGYTFTERYKTMPQSDVINEAPGNFIIPHSTVQVVRLSKGATTNYSDSTTTTTPPSLIFKTTAGKFTFTFNLSIDTKTFIPMLNSLYPGRYKGPKK